MRELLKNRWMQHLTGYGILLFTLSFVSSLDAWTAIWMSAALYALFVLTTKMDRKPTLLALFLMAVCFILKQLLDKNYTRAWQKEEEEAEGLSESPPSARERARTGLKTAILVLWGVFLVVTFAGVGSRLYQVRGEIREGETRFNFLLASSTKKTTFITVCPSAPRAAVFVVAPGKSARVCGRAGGLVERPIQARALYYTVARAGHSLIVASQL